MVTFYFVGHNFEYEVRNTLRIFDLNIKYKIELHSNVDSTYTHNSDGLIIISILDNVNDEYIGSSKLYYNKKLLFESKINMNDIKLEKKNEKKLKKVLVSKTVYVVLSKYYKTKSEYGILTGVRPVKILFTAKHNGKSDEEINDIFENTYEVSSDKLKLLWEVSKIEEKYINIDENKKNYNLYIGIPFCPSKCSYCSFTSYVNYKNEKIKKYIDTLIYEIEKTIELAKSLNLHINSVYFGGGTPSFLNEYEINRIFDSLKKYYDLAKISEITFEAGRPDTITMEKLNILKSNYVNRISINPQTMNQNTLVNIGRKHTVEDIIEKYQLARKVGFKSINMDIILGLPGEDKYYVENTINEIIKLMPDNITVHSLSYKRGASLTKEEHEMTKDYELLSKMQSLVHKSCYEAGFKPYYMYRQKNIKGNLENVGFTLANKESIYNIVIIEEIETVLACGAGVSSKILDENLKHEPIFNFKSIEEYIKRIDEIIEKKKFFINKIKKERMDC